MKCQNLTIGMSRWVKICGRHDFKIINMHERNSPISRLIKEPQLKVDSLKAVASFLDGEIDIHIPEHRWLHTFVSVAVLGRFRPSINLILPDYKDASQVDVLDAVRDLDSRGLIEFDINEHCYSIIDWELGRRVARQFNQTYPDEFINTIKSAKAYYATTGSDDNEIKYLDDRLALINQ